MLGESNLHMRATPLRIQNELFEYTNVKLLKSVSVTELLMCASSVRNTLKATTYVHIDN